MTRSIQTRGSRHGFSLVELLVVIAVIAVIAAIAVPNMANIMQSADKAAKVRNAQQLASTYNTYAEAYYAAHGEYPLSPPTAELAIGLIGGSNRASVTNVNFGTTNTYALPSVDTNNTAIDKLTSSGGQLVYTPE